MLVAIVAGFGSLAASAQTAPPSKSADQAARRSNPGNLVGHGGPVKAIAVDAVLDEILTGAFDYAMGHWFLLANGEAPRFRRYPDHNGAINAVAFADLAPAGPISLRFGLAGGDDHHLTVWRLSTREHEQRFEGHSGKIVAIAVAPGGALVATASWDRTARLWDLAARQNGPVLDGHMGPVNGVAFSADGAKVFTASADGQIRRYDVNSGALDRAIYKHGWGVNVLVRIPGGGDRLLVGALNGSALIIDGETGEAVRELKAHDRPVLAAAVHEKAGLVATGGGDGVVRVMRAADGVVVEEYKNPFGPVWALAFTPAGDGLYYGGLDDFATLWRFAPRKPFEDVDASQYPRRFQLSGKADDPLAKGELSFARKCSICHTLTPDGANRAGPTLHGVFGRKIATLPGYPFSPDLKKLDIVWNADTIGKLFELGPDKFTPGSKMPLQVMTDTAERDALVAFLAVATK